MSSKSYLLGFKVVAPEMKENAITSSNCCTFLFCDSACSYLTTKYLTIIIRTTHKYRYYQAAVWCIEQISDWRCQKSLKLNKDKTEIIFFGAKVD